MTVKAKQKGIQILLLLTGAVLLILLVRRLHYTVSHYDEVFNIYVSYMTVGMEKRHLVENQMMMSMGNLFNLPFVYAFYHVTGGMEGIVLFIRYMYLGLNLLLAVIFYVTINRKLGKKNCIMFALVLISYAPFSIYSIWYDSASLFFLLAGTMLLLGADLGVTKHFGWYRYLAGICHACMVYAYPTMVGVILTILVGKTISSIRKKNRIKEILSYWTPYLIGGITVIMVLVAYIMYIGWDNIFLFKHQAIEGALSGRTLGNMSADINEATNNEAMSPIFAFLQYLLSKLRSILTAMWKQQKAALGITLLLLIQWGVGLRHKGIIRMLLIPEIILTAGWFHNGMGQWATQTMYAYYFFWTPFLFFYLEKEERKQWKGVLFVLDGAAIAAMLAVGFTAYYDMKACMGLYSGAIGTFLLMILITKKNKFLEIPYSLIVILFLAGCNLFMLYHNVYENEQVSQCTHLMQKGIYKGIMAEEKDAIYEILPELFEKIELKEDATLYTNEFVYMPAFIEGNLLINGGDPLGAEERLQEGEDAETVYREYWWTDVIIMDNEKYEECPNVVKDILPQYFDFIYAEDNFYMYVRKESRV